MKKLIFTLLLNGSFVLMNAQSNNEVIKGETLNCRTNELNNLTVNNTEEQAQINKQVSETKVSDTKSKTKKHFIKKVLSNFQGADIKDAWSVVSIN